ncbi:MAG: GLPGLI family protein [Janthinobacterium lividum]
MPALATTAQTPALAPEPAVLVGTYRLTYQPDSTNPTTRTDIHYLLLGKTLSRFTSRATLASDSLLAVFSTLPFNQDNVSLMSDQLMKIPHSRFSYNIYKTAATHRLIYDDRIGLTHYRYEEPASFLTWVITPDRASRAGYACQRATTTFGGRQWEAWFTREVPVSEGPYKFFGLPGLIVQVADTRRYYVFELLTLGKPTTARLVALPAKAPPSTDRATFQRALATYRLDPLASLSAASNGQMRITSLDPTSEQRARENARKRNNPLELR